MAEPASPVEKEPGRARPGVVLGVLLFATYAYFISSPAWNENSRFDLVRSMVERHRLDIDPYQHNTGDKSFRDGHYYSDKAPGTSLLAVPVYAGYYGFLRFTGASTPESVPAAPRDLAELPYLVNSAFRRALYVCNLLTNALGGALLGALFFQILALRWGVAERPALVAAVVLALGSLVLPYATMFYGHVLAALFLFGAYGCLPGEGQPAAPGRLLAGGALAGMAVLVELPTAPATLLVAGCALLVCRPRLRALWFLAGMAGPLLVLLAYQRAAFGAGLRPGYALVSRPAFAEGMSHGLLGVGLPRPGVLLALLIGRARGLLYLSPVLLLGFVGLARRTAAVWEQPAARAEALLASAVVVYFLLMNAGYYMWWGGAALGPRHLIPALPFLCLGVPFAFRRPRPILTGALLAVSVVNVLAATAVQPAAPLVTDVLRDHVYRHLLRGEVPALEGPSNFGLALGLRGPASLVPLLAAWALSLPTLVPASPPRPAAGGKA